MRVGSSGSLSTIPQETDQKLTLADLEPSGTIWNHLELSGTMAEWARLLDWLAEAHVVELDCAGENPKHPKSPGSSNRAAMPETKK